MNKKSYVIMGAFFVGVLSLSLFANFSKIEQEANSLDAQSENPGLQAIGDGMVDSEIPKVDNDAEQATEVTPTELDEQQDDNQKGGFFSNILDFIKGDDKKSDPKNDDAEPAGDGGSKVAQTGGGSGGVYTAPTNPTTSALGDRVFASGGFIIGSPSSGNTVSATTPSGGPISWSQIFSVPLNSLWKSRSEHTMVTFLNQLWMLGGFRLGAASNQNNGIWSSYDGTTWNPQLASGLVPWEQTPMGLPATRVEHASVVYNNKLWVIGGTLVQPNGTQTKMDDVWSSVDGINWVNDLPAGTTSFSLGRHANHEAVVFNGMMIVLGDSDFTKPPILWTSTNGSHWTLSQSNFPAGFGQRRDFGFTAINSGTYKGVYVIGGMKTLEIPVGSGNFVSTRANDVYWSTNGLNYTLKTANAPWSGREKLRSYYFDGKLWVGPGQHDNSTMANDVWSSSDGGATWQPAQSPFPANGLADYGLDILPPVSQVDLKVTDLQWADAPILGKYSHNPINGSATQPAYLLATISNLSGSPFTVPAGVEFKLFLKDLSFPDVVGSFTMTPGQVIPAGGSVDYQFTESLFTGGPGAYYYIRSANFNSTVVVISRIDTTNVVAESDETNNTRTSNIPVNRYLLCNTGTSAPNVYIHFPNGGQQFNRGMGFNAGYDACNINGSNLIEIGIVGYGTLAVGPNTGWQHVVIPTSMAPGSYKFYVRDINSGAIDDSNNPIIIY